MNGEVDNGNDEIDVDDKVDTIGELEDTVVLTEDAADSDCEDDDSVEIGIEKLVAKIESGEGDADAHRKEIHRRLEDLEEARREALDLDSTFNFNLDDDL